MAVCLVSEHLGPMTIDMPPVAEAPPEAEPAGKAGCGCLVNPTPDGGEQPLAPDGWGGLPSVRSARRSADGIALTVEQLHLALPAILARAEPLGLTHLSTHQATLENVFVHLTGRHLRE